ncbi:MAG: hypothetical protein WB755_24960 [Terriglobales bacterium]
MLPSFGSVVGIDVGYSQARRSSAVCRLDWDTTTVRWRIGRSKAIEHERAGIIAEIVGKEMLLAASLDGPLRRGLDVIGQYRAAERMLTRRLAPLIGKPGQANAPVGRQLNAHANACARVLLKSSNLLRSTHKIAIDDLAISEAFPSSFLGLMIKDPASLEAGRGDRSDTFFNYLATNGFLNRLLDHFLPGRRLESSFIEVKNHDDRAALVCALTALSVAGGDFTAVGDENGWIILPPISFIQRWAREKLRQNNSEECRDSLHVERSQ